MKTLTADTQYFLNEAKSAMQEFIAAKSVVLDYTIGKSVKSLKKDAEFLRLTAKMTSAKKLWYDYNTAALLQAKLDKSK